MLNCLGPFLKQKRRFVRIFIMKKKKANCAKPAQASCRRKAKAALNISRSFLRSRDGSEVPNVKGREGGENFIQFCLAPAIFMVKFNMAAEVRDETESGHNYSSNQTLFPILGSESKSVGASYDLLFPCASPKVEELAANVDKGKSNVVARLVESSF